MQLQYLIQTHHVVIKVIIIKTAVTYVMNDLNPQANKGNVRL